MRVAVLCLVSILFYMSTFRVLASENPLAVPNNKFGIHILFVTELAEAAKLVNTNGGDWGYVTIPIQAGDRDLEKWQKFMDESRELHLIPILRLATEGDYFNTKSWRKPEAADILDFANFLDSLYWPTKNRYVIIFNEVNRGDEWSGAPNPEEYAQLLEVAVVTFKQTNADFFVISAGLDNAAPNKAGSYMDQYTFMRRMHEAVPGIFNKIDGLASHSYPNPDFSQPPSRVTGRSISSFRFERDLAKELGGKELPVFITETGWTQERIPYTKQAGYYADALANVWNDPGIVAITPFLLKAGGPPFNIFSFLKEDGGETANYQLLKNLPKTKGAPLLAVHTLDLTKAETSYLPNRNFSLVEAQVRPRKSSISLSTALQSAFKWIMKL